MIRREDILITVFTYLPYLYKKHSSVVIGFCGGTGAGKSTLVAYVTEILGNEKAIVLAQDHYYRHLPELSFEERSEINFDHPNALDLELLAKHIKALQNGNAIKRPVYSFEQHLRLEETVTHNPNAYILVEGILVFAHKPLHDLFDYKVYIEADKEKRIQRRLERDINTRGRTAKEVQERFNSSLHTMHDQFIAPEKENADIVIMNNNLDAAKRQMYQWIETIIT